MAAAGIIVVSVCYVRQPWQVMEYSVELPVGATVMDAINASNLIIDCPEVGQQNIVAGVYGKVCSLDRKLRHGERVEIYRPLHTSPRDRREKNADAG